MLPCIPFQVTLLFFLQSLLLHTLPIQSVLQLQLLLDPWIETVILQVTIGTRYKRTYHSTHAWMDQTWHASWKAGHVNECIIGCQVDRQETACMCQRDVIRDFEALAFINCYYIGCETKALGMQMSGEQWWYPPIQPPVVHMTLSPGVMPSTFFPTAVTTPEHSIPMCNCKNLFFSFIFLQKLPNCFPRLDFSYDCHESLSSATIKSRKFNAA